MDDTIYQRFQDVVARDVSAVAIRHGGQNYTYGELDRRAQHVAASLGLPAGGERPVVAVLLGSDPVAEISAIVGVIAAGAVVLPLDAREPVRHLRRIIDQSGREIRLEIDGGVKIDNIRQIADAGADTFVAGSAT